MAGWNPLAGAADTIEGLIAVLGDAGNARVILFTLVIGSVIGLIQATGGFSGFVEWVEGKNWVTSARGSRLLAWVLGVVIFIESNITVLVSGSVARPLFDRYRISREKLAYLIDSTSAPICILIPLNAWGAFVLGLLSAEGVAQPIVLFGQAIAFNFYAIASVILAGSVAFWGLSWGPMRRAERRVQEGTLHAEGSIPAMDVDDLVPKGYEKAHGPARLAIVPVLVLIVMMPVGLWIAGEGDLTASGIGSIAVLWAVSAALASLWIMLLLGRRNRMDVGALSKITMKGASGLLGLATILLFALALARVAGEMGTGVYLAGVVDDALPMFLLPALTFLVAAGIAFSTGTSWGTFGIMIPIVVQVGATLGIPLAPLVAAALSGGIFGDHSSPISDTTIISSMAAAVDHIEHVRTQLPYAMTAGGVALVAFLLAGLAIT
jgi:tetracycline resistance efflux pump